MNIEPLHPEFGARITGYDLSRADTAEDIQQIHEWIQTWSFLAFPDQEMSDDLQLKLTEQLGEPEAEHVIYGSTGKVEFFGTVGNVDDAGNQRGNTHSRTHYQKGNNLWHSDSSFREVPSYVSITYPYEVPGEGGITEFVSQRSAYHRLQDEKKHSLEELRVIHDYVFSRTQKAPVDFNHAASLPPVKHPMVRTDPANGELNLYIGSHARSVVGMGGIESRQLLDQLLEHTTRPESVYAHQWVAGEVIIWDNRCLLHRGTGYDADRWRRRMRQTRVVGEHQGEI